MTCAKRQVACFITDARGGEVVGRNDCLNPQSACPRTPGEGYEKCKTICRQGGHAETEAINRAARLGMDMRGATARVTGHYWICEPCGRALREAGVTSVLVELAQ